jgi:hypothetical protein
MSFIGQEQMLQQALAEKYHQCMHVQDGRARAQCGALMLPTYIIGQAERVASFIQIISCRCWRGLVKGLR